MSQRARRPALRGRARRVACRLLTGRKAARPGSARATDSPTATDQAATRVEIRSAASSSTRGTPNSSATTSRGSPARKPRECILDPRAAAGEDGLSESAGGVNEHVGHGVRRKPDQPRVAGLVELDALQVRLDHVVEDALVAADDDELADSAARLGVCRRLREVVEHLGAVGEQPTRRQRVPDPELLLQTGERRPDPLQRHAAPPHRGQDEAFSEPDEGITGPRALVLATLVRIGSMVTGGRSTDSRR